VFRQPRKGVSMCRVGSLLALLLSVAMASLSPLPPAGAADPSPPWGAPWETAIRADNSEVGTIRDATTGESLTPEALAARLVGADVVLLGEKHDNPDHHRAQAWLLDQMVAAGRRPAVVMEMLDGDQVDALADYRTRPDADAAGMGPAVGWGESGWPDWSTYQPIAAVALAADLPILPGNLTRDQVRRLSREGAAAVLGEDGLAPRGLDRPLPEALNDSLGREILDSHCGMLPERAVPPMVAVQRARDGEMARALLEGLSRSDTDGAVLIAGNGHTRADRGVPWVLRQLAPDLSVVSVGILEVPPPASEDDPGGDSDNARPFDLVWMTPALEDVDPCEKFRAQLEQMRERHGGEAPATE